MTVNLSPLAGAGQQFFDDSGVPLAGGKLYSYQAGTTTPQVTYTTVAGNVPHSNPIILNAAGRVATGEIWLTSGQNYKFVLKTSTEVTIATWDNIVGINGTGIATNALYVQYDPAGAGAVATNVQAKLRESVSVKDFGAVGDGVTDDTAAVQAFFDYVAVNSVGIAVLEGNLKITSGVNLTGSATKFYRANCNLIGGAAISGPMLTITNASFVRFSGSLQLTGTGGADYLSRTVDSGLLLVNSGRIQFEFIRAENFKLYGVHSEGGNSNLVDWGNLRFLHCGSKDNGVSSLSSAFSSRSNTGSADSRAQRTVLSGVTVPSGIFPLRSMALISGDPYMITASNVGAGTVEVYPWVPSTIASGTINFILGAAFYSTGADNNAQTIQTLDATNCSIACLTPVIFSETFQKLVIQNCAIGVTIGNGITSGSQGANYDYAYFESNVYDIIQTTSAEVRCKFGPASTINLDKVVTLPPLDLSDIKRAASESFNTTLLIHDGAPFFYTQNGPRNSTGSVETLTLKPTPGNFKSVRSNAFTLSLESDDNYNRLFGNQDAYCMILGTGPRNNPTGTITVTPATGTVNGLASTTFTSTTGPLLLHCFWQQSLNNWIVTPWRNETLLIGSATYNPPSLNDGDGVTTTITVTGATLGDFADVSFNVDLQGIMMTAWVSATDTVSVRFQNETGGVLDLGNGTLRAQVRKAV